MSITPVIGLGPVNTDAGLASAMADLRRRLAQMEATRTLINDGSLTGAQIANGAITAGNIAAGSITTELITAGAITTGLLAAGAVVANSIAAGAITAGKIATDAVTANTILAGAVTAGKIAAGAVQASNITVTDLSSITGNLGNITAGLITGATFQTSASAAGKVVMDSAGLRGYGLDGVTKVFEINSGSGIATFTGIANIDPSSVIPGGAIVDGSITGAEIHAGAITATHIAAGAIDASSIAITFSGPNVVQNSGFEYGKYDGSVYSTAMQKWNAIAGTVMTSSTAQAYEGARSGKIAYPGTNITAFPGPVTSTQTAPTVGNLGRTPGTYTYRVTAVKGGVEVTSYDAPPITVTAASLSQPTLTAGTSTIDATATHKQETRKYVISALGSSGETIASNEVSVVGVRDTVPTPTGFGYTVGASGSGSLPGGTYAYKLYANGPASLFGSGNTAATNYLNVTVPVTHLANPTVQPTIEDPGDGYGYGLPNGYVYNFYLVICDQGVVYDFTPDDNGSLPTPTLTYDLTSAGDYRPILLHWNSSDYDSNAFSFYIYYEQVDGDGIHSFGPFDENVTVVQFNDSNSVYDDFSNYWYDNFPSGLPSANNTRKFDRSINLTWSAAAGAIQYMVVTYDEEDSYEPDGTIWRVKKTVNAPTTSLSITSTAGWGSTGGTTSPVANSTDRAHTKYPVTWTGVPGATGYRLYLTEAYVDALGKVDIAGGATTSYEDKTTTFSGATAPPTTGTATANPSVRVAWTPLSIGADTYRIYRGTAGRMAEVSGGSSFVDDTGQSLNGSLQPPSSSAGISTGSSDAAIYSIDYAIYPAAKYVLSGYLRGDTGTIGKTAHLIAEIYNGSTLVQTIDKSVTLTGAWQLVAADPTLTDASATKAVIRIKGDTLSGGDFLYADAIQFEKAANRSEYSPRFDDYVPGSVGPTILTPNSITTDQILVRGIQADRLVANSITALEIAAGAITATTIAATAIDGKTITGATIRTAAPGVARVQLDSTGFTARNSSDSVTAAISGSTGAIDITAASSGYGTNIFVDRKLRWLATAGGSPTAIIGADANGQMEFRAARTGAGSSRIDLWAEAGGLYAATNFSLLSITQNSSSPTTGSIGAQVNGQFVTILDGNKGSTFPQKNWWRAGILNPSNSWTQTFSSMGGTAMFFVSATGYTTSTGTAVQWVVNVNGSAMGYMTVAPTLAAGVHQAMPSLYFIATLVSGTNSISAGITSGVADGQDQVNWGVIQ